MASNEKNLEQFLRKELGKNREAPLVKLVLRHAAPGAKGVQVEVFNLPDEGLTVEDLPSLVSQILSTAQADADGNGGIQRYSLAAFEKLNTSPVARHVFRIRGEEGEWDEGAGEEAPTAKGIIQMQMRHNEALMRMALMGAQANMNAMTARMSKQDALIDKLLDEREAGQRLLEEAKSEQHERELEYMKVGSEEKRKDEIFKRISDLAPVVLNKLAGQKLVDADDPMTLMLRNLVGSLSPEQFQVLSKALTQEQQILLVSIIDTVRKSDAAKQAKELTAGNGETKSE